MLVEVRRADRQPAIVDDPDLRVDVDRTRPELAECRDRAREHPSCAAVAFDQVGELTTRVVATVVRIDRQHEHNTEVVGRGCASFSSRIRAISLDQKNWFSRYTSLRA